VKNKTLLAKASTALLSVILVMAVPASALQEQRDEKQDRPEQKQQNKQAQAKPEQQHAQQKSQPAQKQQQPQHAQQAQRPEQNKQPQQAKQQSRPERNKQQQQAHASPHSTQQQQHVQQAAFQQHRTGNWQSDHRTWQQRGGYNGYRIPDDRFRGYFGPEHGFRIYGLPFETLGGYPRFQYQGYWMSLVDPWPNSWANNWYDTDNVYVNYVDNGYYLFDTRYPGVGLAISISN